jgi:hypothetical protein
MNLQAIRQTRAQKAIANISDGENEEQVNSREKLRDKDGKVRATIYKTSAGYRLYWRQRVDGKPKSQMMPFPTKAQARKKGKSVVADLAKGKTIALTPAQVADAQNAIEELQRLYQTTGKRAFFLFAGEWPHGFILFKYELERGAGCSCPYRKSRFIHWREKPRFRGGVAFEYTGVF